MAATTATSDAGSPASRRLVPAVAFLVILIAVWAASLVLHELWHGLTAQALGGQVIWLRVRPGIELWPAFGRVPDEPWGTTGILAIGFYTGPTWQADGWQSPVVSVMGSGGNLLLAALALGALWRFRPRGGLRLLLMAQALMFADLLLYCVLPGFFGLPHYLFYGGDVAEPLEGAVRLGCPRWAFLLFVMLVSALMAWGVVAYARRGQRNARPADPVTAKPACSAPS